MAETNESRLYNAVSGRNINEVLNVLNEIVNLDDTFEYYEVTALIRACAINETNIALALIEKGANVNARDKNGNTALMHASRHGNTILATSLIRKKADLNAVDINGDTALNLACKHMSSKTALSLIENGANVNIRNKHKESPLRSACQYNREDVVESLLHNGADVNEVDLDGNTALHLACKNGNTDLALILIKNGVSVNLRNNENKTPLRLASEKNFTDIVVSLMHNGAEVNEVDLDGNTVLHLACLNRKDGMALVLIENGANVNVRNKAKLSPLSFACENELFPVVVSLLHNGAEVNEINGLNNETALHYAAVKNNKDIISILLHNGADMNALNKNGKTPLHLAFENKSTDAVEVIRIYGERCANATKINPGTSSASKKVEDAVKTNKYVEKELEKVNQKLGELKLLTGSFDKTLQTIITRLEQLETKAKSNDQENFKNVLEIAGIESKENEDLNLILKKLAEILDLSLQDKDNIISVHRPVTISPATDSASAATNCSNVIEVKFRTFETTQNWLKAFQDKRSSGITSSALDPSLKSEKIFVNQKLTLYNKKLLHRAKEFAKDKGYKFVWVQDGKILLREDENSRVIRIKRDADLPN